MGGGEEGREGDGEQAEGSADVYDISFKLCMGSRNARLSFRRIVCCDDCVKFKDLVISFMSIILLSIGLYANGECSRIRDG